MSGRLLLTKLSPLLILIGTLQFPMPTFGEDNAGECVAVSCWQTSLQGQSQDSLTQMMLNNSLPASQRYAACLAVDPRGCSGLQQAALAAGDTSAAGSAAGAGVAGGAAGAAANTFESECPYTEAGSPSPPNTPEEAEVANCSATEATTDTACRTPGTKGMDPGTAAMFTVMVTQLPQLATQIASAGKNMAQQCRLQADVNKLMATINGVKGSACGVMISRCNSRCGDIANRFRQAAQQLRSQGTANEAAAQKCEQAANKAIRVSNRCNTYASQVAAMMMGAMQNGASIVQNQQCAREAEALANMPVPTFSPIAMPNPTDCTDPNNQSFACFCTREVNKSSPMCAGFNGGGLAGGGASPTGPSNGIGSSVATPFLGTDTDGDGIADDPVALQQKQNASGGDGFSPGGGSAPGGGGLGGFGGDDGGMGAPGDPRSAITGTSGGTGSGLGGGGGGGGGLARNNGGAGGAGNFMDKFNLKRFLPGSKYKARGIAGMSVKSVDGITGPMGPSIWEKATRQYQEQIQKQNVILDNK